MNTQSTQRFVSDVARPRIASCRDAPQRNDLLVTSRLAASHRIASQLTSTQRFVCYQRLAAWLPASHCAATTRAATQLNDLFITTLRPAAIRIALLLNSTICLLRRNAAYGIAALLGATQLNDLLVTPLRSAPFRFSSQRTSPRRNATICFLQRAVLHYSATLRAASQRAASQRFVCYQRTFPALRRPKSRRPASQLNVIAN